MWPVYCIALFSHVITMREKKFRECENKELIIFVL